MSGSCARTKAIAGLSALVSLAICFASGQAQAQAQAHEDVNAANNPLTPKITLNFQNFYTPDIVGLGGRQSNAFLLRGLIPADFFGQPQLFRYTLPIATAPQFPSGYETGLGDLTLLDILLFPGETVSFGAGPLLVVPTATDDSLGAGKWQAGAAGVAIAPQKWGLLGALVTYQASFAGDRDRDDVSLLTVEPVINYNLKDGFYLRSTATANFDLDTGDYFVPVGLGIGKVFKPSEHTTLNAFIEPQYTVFNEGVGNPRWQILVGLNVQFDIGQ
ncbi:hypothetical protein [Aureimonas frigidaquae]|uniref:hypothetical protein n=1 Tax=Aureimonas frigidaquae TaxID=424757 RepID=UPI0007814FEB|nr:hypothetical protein [Aureimonas frigidaquae]